MKASDLRILNKILFSEDGTVCEVLEIDLNGLRVDCGDGEVVWIEIEQFDGIPLTEEWLFKFGFIKMDWTENENCYEKSFVLQKDDKEGYNLMDNDVATLQQFKYVHQLQNLYFALTGEELTLKES